MPKHKAEHHESHKAHPLLLRRPSNRPQILVGVLVFASLLGIYLVYSGHAASDTLSLVPSSSTVSLGSNFTVAVHENSNTDAINAVESDLTYDKTKLNLVSIDTTTNTNFNSPAGACPSVSPSPISNTGTIQIACAKFTSTLTGDQVVANITFTAIGTGAAAVSFANTSSIIRASDTVNVLAGSTGGTYTIADTTPPTAPTGLVLSAHTDTSITLAWTASTDNVGVAGYKVFRNGTQVGGNILGTSYSDIGLTPNTTYTYTVVAFDAAGNVSTTSVGSALATLPDTTPPSVPTGLAAPTKTVTTLGLTWTPSTDDVAVVGYHIYRSGALLQSVVSANFTDTGLTPNTSYSYTIAAYDGAGNLSAQSTPVAFSTLADTTPPSVPVGLATSNVASTSLTLSWTASTDNVGVTGYKVFRNGAQVGTAVTTSYSDTGLASGTSYTYTVSAYDGAGNNSALSTGLVIKTVIKPGDVNGDGAVNIIDLSILAQNYGLSGATRAQGDLNGDGVVNILDLSILATNFGT
ncbi:MAG: fibronectin type III domain-containing protein [Candidatus Saccharimonadia bacterium]